MKKNIVCLALGLGISISAMAEITPLSTLSVPVQNILAAARKIEPQIGFGYVFEGILECTQVSQIIAPFEVDSKCTVAQGARVESVNNPEEIIEKLKLVKKKTGPAYYFSSKIYASSITQHAAPHLVAEFAEIIFSLSIPPSNLLAAARKIAPQMGPAYFVEGVLECSQVSQNFSPFMVYSQCTIEVDGAKESVANPEEIIKAHQLVRRKTGPHYYFRTKFSASSLSSQMAPFTPKQSAEAILFN